MRVRATPRRGLVGALALALLLTHSGRSLASEVSEEGPSPNLCARQANNLARLVGQQRSISPSALGPFVEWAVSCESDEVGLLATSVLVSALQFEHAKENDVVPQLEALLKVAETAAVEARRIAALDGIATVGPKIGDVELDRLAELLVDEQNSREVRLAAARAMIIAPNHEMVLEAYAKAFEKDQDPCFRWWLIRLALQMAGRDALPWLVDLVSKGSLFAFEVDKILKFYEDPDAKWAALVLLLDELHPECLP